MSIENPSREEMGAMLKKAKRIAVVGLSDNPDRTSYMISEAMKKAGYEIISSESPSRRGPWHEGRFYTERN